MKTIQEEIQELAEAKSVFTEEGNLWLFDFMEGDSDEARKYNTQVAKINDLVYIMVSHAEMNYQNVVDAVAVLLELNK